MPVPVYCMFFVSQKIHIERSPNAINFYGELFWNICDFWEVESMQGGSCGPHKAPGRSRGARRAVVPREALVGRLVLFFGRKEANIRKKILLKFQRNQSYGSLGI